MYYILTWEQPQYHLAIKLVRWTIYKFKITKLISFFILYTSLKEIKFLVTGSAGFVGRQIARDLSESGTKLYCSYHTSRPEFGTQAKMDLTRDDDIIKTIQKIKPDVIIHVAAMAEVDLCEKEKEMATRINAEATRTISEQAAKIGSFLVYVSTDYVFDGNKGMRVESDTPNPINHYGRSKLGGENAVQDKARKWCIARTSIPYGIHPTLKRFLTLVAQSLKEKKEFSLTTDQYICPTYLPNLSKMIIEIAARQIAGIIHVSGATRLSRYQMSEMLADKMGLDKKFLKPVKISEMKNWTAKRPQDSSLDVSKATRILKEKPLGIEPGLDYFIKQLSPML